MAGEDTNAATDPTSGEVARTEREPVDPWRSAFDRWVDRWPAMFSGRMPEFWSGDQLRVEEFVEDDTLVVRTEIPGVNPDDDIEIDVDRGRLRITARREEREEVKDDTSYRSEFHYGSFSRSVELPPGTDPGEITATYDDGILEVRAPYAAGGGERRRVAVTKS